MVADGMARIDRLLTNGAYAAGRARSLPPLGPPPDGDRGDGLRSADPVAAILRQAAPGPHWWSERRCRRQDRAGRRCGIAGTRSVSRLSRGRRRASDDRERDYVVEHHRHGGPTRGLRRRGISVVTRTSMMTGHRRSRALRQGPRNALDTLRRRGVRAWAAIGWLSLGLLLVCDAALRADAAVPLLILGGSLNIAPTIFAIRGSYDGAARAVMGTLAAAIPAMLVFLLQGHPWQMDAHMYFFVAMAALVVLADWRPIAIATALTAVHHLSLEWLAPEWVFTGAGNLGRVIFHVVAVGLQFGVLTALTIQLQHLFSSQEETLRHAQDLTLLAEEGRQRTEQAMEQARAAEAEAARERQRREEQTARMAVERRGELVTLANEFEFSVTSMVKIIGDATEHLQTAAVQLETFTGDTTQEASKVASTASTAALEIAQVASSIRDLSRSIQTVGSAADRQTALTLAASNEAQRSVQTVAMLEEQALEIEGFLDTIRAIATRSNLLALNATIEAARAGDAGRGFVVVAGEVKSLSVETKSASDRISSLIEAIREGVADTAQKLRSVNGALGEVSAAASSIADVVDEQRTTARGVDTGAERVTRSAEEVECRMSGVAQAAGVASTLSVAVRTSASDLASSARNLRLSTDQFVLFLKDDPGLAA
ncbi:methyl-accepting chemotaxis protein [Sphingomonas sp. 1P08PE]|uniref:methyl-accepting chemotaxis protein n=1 Tax=Sphingomonas sp. 1P08PE TaxID=554122 RepID=UPI00399F7C17